MTYEGCIRCARANLTRSANLLEAAKDASSIGDNDGYERLYAKACMAEERGREWLEEAKKLSSGAHDLKKA